MDRDVYRPPDREKYLLADEISKLLTAAAKAGAAERRFLAFMANTGVRPSESNQVLASDVHLEESRIRVTTIKQKDGRKIFRDVDVSKGFSKDLTWVKSLKSNQLLFPMTRFGLWRIFKRVAKAAGLSKSYTLYSLRHSRAIYLLEWTGDLKYVQQQLGHSSIAITSVYLHCTPSKRQSYVSDKLKSF